MILLPRKKESLAILEWHENLMTVFILWGGVNCPFRDGSLHDIGESSTCWNSVQLLYCFSSDSQRGKWQHDGVIGDKFLLLPWQLPSRATSALCSLQKSYCDDLSGPSQNQRPWRASTSSCVENITVMFHPKISNVIISSHFVCCRKPP